jgi:hypothetical protein
MVPLPHFPAPLFGFAVVTLAYSTPWLAAGEKESLEHVGAGPPVGCNHPEQVLAEIRPRKSVPSPITAK